MTKYLVLVEGFADATFIRDYLKHIYPEAILIKEESKTKTLTIGTVIVKISVVGGYTALTEKLRVKIKEYVDSEYKIIVIQDADSPKIENGGAFERSKYLDQVKKEVGVKFDSFLFPNNSDDGDLEVLLLAIANHKKIGPALDCYKDYAGCVERIGVDQKHVSELLEDKNLVFCYFRTYYGIKNAKENNRLYSLEYWNLNDEYLEPLSNFFKEKI